MNDRDRTRRRRVEDPAPRDDDATARPGAATGHRRPPPERRGAPHGRRASDRRAPERRHGPGRRASDRGAPERRHGPGRRTLDFAAAARVEDAFGRFREAAGAGLRRAHDRVRRRFHPRRPSRPRDPHASWVQRGREFARRARGPIIGITLASAAAPLIRQAEAPRAREPGDTGERRRGEQPLPPSGSPDEFGRRWAELFEARVRDETVEGARVRYGINRQLAEDIHDIAVEEGIEPDVAYGLVNTESSFKRRAVSPVGARGLAQLMPRTARELMPGITNEDLFDRRINLRLGFRYLNQLMDKYDGNLRLALLAYNRGPGTVDRIVKRGGDPDNGYADLVLRG